MITDVLKHMSSEQIISMVQRGGMNKAATYELIASLASMRREPSETEAPAFTKFVTYDDLGSRLYYLHKAMDGRDVALPQPTTAVKKNLNTPELDWNGLVAGIVKLTGWSPSKAGDEARKTPDGQKLWKAWHRPPVTEPPAPSRGVGDAGLTPPQWRSPHAGSQPTDAERDIQGLDYMEPDAVLEWFNEIADELASKFNLCHSQAADRARLKHPLGKKLWARLHRPPGEAEFNKRRADPPDTHPTDWEKRLNDVLRKDSSLSESQAIDAAMRMPGGKEAWLEHKSQARAALL